MWEEGGADPQANPEKGDMDIEEAAFGNRTMASVPRPGSMLMLPLGGSHETLGSPFPG